MTDFSAATLALLVLVNALNLGDAITTWLCLRRRLGREKNPIMRWLFDTLGIEVGLSIKMALYLAVSMMIADEMPLLLILYGLPFAYAVWNNGRIIRDAG